MELRQLRYFLAIAEHGSFGSAAKNLFIAQPALSRQIGELENELQIRLFERQARGIALTAAGQAFQNDVRKILADLEQAKKRAMQTASGQLGKLHVGLIEYFSWHPSAINSISRFREEHPHIALTLSTSETSLKIQEEILRGTLDCGFMFNRLGDEKQLAGKPLVSVGFLLAVPANLPIARAKTMRLADMAKEPFVWIPREIAPVHYDRLLMMCNQAGFSPKIAQYATTETGRLSMVAAGVGCAIITSAAELAKPERVKLVALSDVHLKINLEVVWRPDNDSPTLKNFLHAVGQGESTTKQK